MGSYSKTRSSKQKSNKSKNKRRTNILRDNRQEIQSALPMLWVEGAFFFFLGPADDTLFGLA
jgi:hypothetical protein